MSQDNITWIVATASVASPLWFSHVNEVIQVVMGVSSIIWVVTQIYFKVKGK
jgi:hypothetical protein